MTEFLLQSEACLVETPSRRGAGLLREGIMGLREQVVASEVLAFKTDYTAVELRVTHAQDDAVSHGNISHT